MALHSPKVALVLRLTSFNVIWIIHSDPIGRFKRLTLDAAKGLLSVSQATLKFRL